MSELKKLMMERLEELIEAYGLMEGFDIWEREVDSTMVEIQEELMNQLIRQLLALHSLSQTLVYLHLTFKDRLRHFCIIKTKKT